MIVAFKRLLAKIIAALLTAALDLCFMFVFYYY